MEMKWNSHECEDFCFLIVDRFQICLQRFMGMTCVKSELDVSGLNNAYRLFFFSSFFAIFLINHGDV